MKKTIGLFLTAVLWLMNFTAYPYSPEPKYHDMNGNIASYKQVNYTFTEHSGILVPEEATSIYVYYFDNRGNLSKSEWLDPDGTLNWVSEYKYDGKNMTYRKSVFFGTDVYEDTLKTQYDDYEGWEFKIGGELFQIYDIIWNNPHHVTKTVRDASRNIIYHEDAKYNIYGNLASVVTTFPDGKTTIMESRRTYDDRRRVIEEYDHDAVENESNTATYKYTAQDSAGNWTERIAYRNGKPDYITRREITYGGAFNP